MKNVFPLSLFIQLRMQKILLNVCFIRFLFGISFLSKFLVQLLLSFSPPFDFRHQFCQSFLIDLQILYGTRTGVEFYYCQISRSVEGSSHAAYFTPVNSGRCETNPLQLSFPFHYPTHILINFLFLD